MKQPFRTILIKFGAISAITSALALTSCDDSGDGHDHSTHDHSAAASTTNSTDAYPLTTCVVTGEPLGSMGEPVVIKHEGKTVKFCCSGCEDDFNENPAKYLAMISEAAKKAPAN